jgi:NADH-quinone oxidoreductase subunit A
MILLAYFLTLIIIVLVIILIAVYVLNLNKNYYNKQSAYECGFDSFGDARGSHDNHFYFVGFLFVIFDLEIVFLIPILTGLDQLTTLEYLYFVIFVGILVLGLCIEWAIGVLQ